MNVTETVVIEAWVNGNPEPRIHAFGTMKPRHTLTLCRIVVRERRGQFDPDDPQACEDCARYVRDGLDFEAASREVSKQVAQWFEDQIGPHKDHPWEQVGRCVYCGPCGTRLYQGTIPDDQPKFKRPRKPTVADEMRARWGKD